MRVILRSSTLTRNPTISTVLSHWSQTQMAPISSVIWISQRPNVKAYLNKCIISTRNFLPVYLANVTICGGHSFHNFSSVIRRLYHRRSQNIHTNVCCQNTSHSICNFKCDSNDRRGLSSRNCSGVENKPDMDEICEEIYKNIIFNNGSIVAINKPHGLSVFGRSSDGTEKSTENMTISKHPSASVIRSLPMLRNKLTCSYLGIGLSLKSFYSGIVLLCKSKQSEKSLNTTLAAAGPQKSQFMTYLAITDGTPQCSHGVNLLAGIKREWLHDKEMSDFSEKIITSWCKQGKMIKVNYSVTPLVVNQDNNAALVQVTINKDKWEAVQVLLTQYLSPVVGDNIYSSRKIMAGGVPFLASAEAAVPGTQRLSPKIAESLYSSTVYTQDKGIPLFLHRHQVVLHRFPKDSSPPLTITAPPHKNFLTALQCLGLYKEGMFSKIS